MWWRFQRFIRYHLADKEGEKRAFSFISTAFFLILFVFGFWPTLINFLGLRQKVILAEGEERRLEKEIDDLKLAVENINSEKPNLRLIEDSLPDGQDFPKLLESLNAVFGRNNIVIEEISFSKAEDQKASNLFVLPLTIRVSGTFENILSALEILEKIPRPTRITKLLMDVPNKGDKAFLRANLNLETYFLKEEDN